MSRLLLVSNRLPITAEVAEGHIRIELSSGGLATGLRTPHREYGGFWIGWPGDLPRLDQAQRADLEESLAAERLVPVYLSREETRDFYEEIANGTLWPVFHYLVDQESMHTRGWQTFVAVNRRFAEAVIDAYEPGDIIWVHDYHLMLVPRMVREALPDARIGFFLHIPFPSSEIFSVLPWRQEILEGMLGSDLIGFHTGEYVRHFASTVHRLLGIDLVGGRLQADHREVTVGAFPMGIDVAAWEARALDPAVQERARSIRSDANGRAIVLGIDRLDFSKGLVRRFFAMEQLLNGSQDLGRRIRFIQVIVPSREGVESYASLRRRINELVGRINSTYSTPSAVPVHLIYRGLDEMEVSALYCATDVMFVTPVRDGMNLVAKEFVASRVDEDGVLVLSEFAGAAEELQQALLVNPYDVDSMASAIERALSMSKQARRARMQVLRQIVHGSDVHYWVQSFLHTLGAERPAAAPA